MPPVATQISGYCSKEHQRADWPMHKLMCDAKFQNLGVVLQQMPRDQWVLAARRMAEHEKASAASVVDTGQETKLGDVTVTLKAKPLSPGTNCVCCVCVLCAVYAVCCCECLRVPLSEHRSRSQSL